MQNRIKVVDLIAEIKTSLEDMFIANIRISEGKIEIGFLNGQKFIVSVENA
jgi:hypothetical protein